MEKYTNKSKKIKKIYLKTTFIICFIMMISFPWIGGIINKSVTNKYYKVYINNKYVGATTDYGLINETLKKARKQISSEAQTPQFVKADLDVKTEKRIFAKQTNENKLIDNIYQELKTDLAKDSENTYQKAYMVDIGGYSVTLQSLSDVEYLFNEVKNEYSDNAFNTNLSLIDNNGRKTITCNIVKANVSENDIPVVAAAQNQTTENATQSGGETTEVTFGENVEIVPCYVGSKQISELNDAIDLVNGDTDHQELSVIVQEKQTYTEDYVKDIEYVYNDGLFNNQQNVLNEGAPGTKQIIANVTLKNGKEVGREILNETVIKEAEARQIEIGTVAPPTFVKPISGGSLSSTFGPRWGTVHKGVDWSCGVGTKVKASSSGIVIQAGWVNGYGKCITLRHSNGICTRYGHLSQILVNDGDAVNQFDVIALSGNTGDSTGPHVHFEILENGVQVNPFKYLE